MKPVRPKAYKEGADAVRLAPEYAPRNPYNSETQPDQYASWEEGTYDAGICEFYVNGVRRDVLDRWRQAYIKGHKPKPPA